jgi:hypothetical protein
MADQEKEKVDRNAVDIAKLSAISAISVAALTLVGTVATVMLGNLDKLPRGIIPTNRPQDSTSVKIPPSPSPKITIDLKKGQKVDQKQTITGTVEGVMPSDKVLYIYVYVPRLQDFPFYYSPVKIDSPTWNAHVIFGAVEDSKLSFQTGLVLADPKDPKFRSQNSDNGISELIGEKVVDTEITVQRR